jgi:hypothetical protein
MLHYHQRIICQDAQIKDLERATLFIHAYTGAMKAIHTHTHIPQRHKSHCM